MGRIHLLSDAAASQVAAGEVVERPASVIKELIENAYDAGAGSIHIEFASGGRRLMVVEDDGCGMDRDDALLSLERHATSKIRDASDLLGVRSMGFRGEALPSIASVSKFRLLTRVADSPAGCEVRVEGGKVLSVREAGCAPGTRAEVHNLFFNVPARKKFLRGDETEAAQIAAVVQGFSLAFPALAIRLVRDGRETLSLPAASDLRTRIHDLFGSRFLERLIPLRIEAFEGLVVEGFVSKPGEGRRDRQLQTVILNGRPVQCPEIFQPLREAYAGSLTAGSHPLAVLHVDLSTELVDCNVHPAKRQVRLSRPDAVRRAVFDGVAAALNAYSKPASIPSPPASPGRIVAPDPVLRLERAAPPMQAPMSPPAGRSDSVAAADTAMAAPPASAPTNPANPELPYRLIGRFGGYYFAFEGPEGLVLLDARPARERIAFEHLLRQIENGNPSSQRLLLPEVIEFPPREFAWIAENLDPLRQSGFAIEPFGGLSLKIEAVPALAANRPVASLLHEVAESLRAAGRLPRGRGFYELLARTVCRQPQSPPADSHGIEILAELLRCDLPYAGPNGNPTLIQFSFAELERKFGGRSPSA